MQSNRPKLAAAQPTQLSSPHGDHPRQPPPPPYDGAPHGYPTNPARFDGNRTPLSNGVPTWVWIALGVVVMGFLCLTAVVATAIVFARARASERAPLATRDVPPVDEPESAGVPRAPRSPAALPPVQRHVPIHDVSLLKGCSAGDKATIERRLSAAIKVGAPSYNAGDFEGCYSTYESAAAKLELALSATCKGPTAALEAGRRTAREKGTSSDRAWAMRDSFDGLFEVIERAEK